jgi:hypothetical protein
MADTQEQSLSTITPVDGDYFRAVDDPGGSPESANVTGTALKAYLKTYNDTLYYGTANVSYVSSDFSKISDTTLANITGLTFTTASGGKYRFHANLFLSCGASGGAKVAISGTNTATKIQYLTSLRTTTAFVGEVNTALDGDYGTTAAHVLGEIVGYIDVNEGGTLTVQFAQNASNGTASIVLAGSWFEVDKIG